MHLRASTRFETPPPTPTAAPAPPPPHLAAWPSPRPPPPPPSAPPSHLPQGPLPLMTEMYAKHGEVFTIPLLHKRMTFLVGPHVSPHFFNATDDKMSQTEVRRGFAQGRPRRVGAGLRGGGPWELVERCLLPLPPGPQAGEGWPLASNLLILHHSSIRRCTTSMCPPLARASCMTWTSACGPSSFALWPTRCAPPSCAPMSPPSSRWAAAAPAPAAAGEVSRS